MKKKKKKLSTDYILNINYKGLLILLIFFIPKSKQISGEKKNYFNPSGTESNSSHPNIINVREQDPILVHIKKFCIL